MNQSSLNETQEFMEVIKRQSQAQGLTQAQLAEKLQVSLPTLKRWLAGKGLLLENLFSLLKALDLSLDELAALLPQSRQKSFSYSLKQEDFFAQRPEFLSYFDCLLSGKTPQEIERLYQISHRSTRKYLKELEKLGLIEVHPQDRVKLLVQGEPVWRENGKLALTLRKKVIDEFLKEVGEKKQTLKFFLHDYSPENMIEMEEEIKKLIQKAKLSHKRSQFSSSASRSCGLMIGLSPFKWSLLDSIREL